MPVRMGHRAQRVLATLREADRMARGDSVLYEEQSEMPCLDGGVSFMMVTIP